MGSTYHTPVFIGLLCVMCFAAVLLLHHCVLLVCRRRRRHRLRGPGTGRQQQQGEEAEDEDEEAGSRSSVDMSSSRTHLVKGAVAPPPVVCPYRKGEEAWGESTCPVCLADFADGEPVRVLPECMHYFHAECIDTWLRGGSTSCPMCRAETTPTPTPSPGELQHHDLSASASASLEDILVRT